MHIKSTNISISSADNKCKSQLLRMDPRDALRQPMTQADTHRRALGVLNSRRSSIEPSLQHLRLSTCRGTNFSRVQSLGQGTEGNIVISYNTTDTRNRSTYRTKHVYLTSSSRLDASSALDEAPWPSTGIAAVTRSARRDRLTFRRPPTAHRTPVRCPAACSRYDRSVRATPL